MSVQTRNVPSHLLTVFFLLILVIGSAGYLYFTIKKGEIEHATQDELSTIATLKVNEISWWRRERLADATVITQNPIIGRTIGNWLSGNQETDTGQAVYSWMESLKRNYDYRDVVLVDDSGLVRLSVSGRRTIGEKLSGYLPEVMSTRKPLLFDLYRSDTSGGIHIDLLAPIIDSGAPGAPVVGVLILQIDPHTFLYPLIQKWPTLSPTAESLLVRLEGDELLYLNELRHQDGTALSLRFPVTAESLPAARAVRGEEGIVQGIDYRGVPVLAALRAISDSPWFLVAKVDLAEIHGPIGQRAFLIFVFIGLFTMASGAGLLFYWSRGAREELEVKVRERTAELSASEALLQNVLDTLPVGVWIADKEGKITRVNPAGREIWEGARYVGFEEYGEYKGWWIDSGERIEADEWALARALMKGETSINEVVEIEAFDKSRKIILNSGAPVRDAQGEIISAIVVNEDITEKRLVETYTLASNTLLKLMSQASSRKEYTDAAVDEIRKLSRCRYVGLRLLDQDGTIPYESYVGYSKEFWDQENRLILARNDCACTRVISGKFEPQDAPFLSPSGSFFCGSLSGLLSELSEEEMTRFRGMCIKSGFGSVAVIPLRHEGRVLGGIHLADEREGMVPLMTVELVESFAALIAEAIVKFETREELGRYTEKLEQSNKALEEFAYVASHDLQEPLRKIAAFGDRLSNVCGDSIGAEGQDYIRRMQAASSRMQQLIHALLEYSRVTSKPKSLKEVPLRGIVEGVLADLEVRIEETRAQVQVGELPILRVDSHQMRQLFQNLIGNAIKYQSPEHRPHVKVRSEPLRNGVCRITVEDNGIGFEEKYLDRIFAPFQRLHGRNSEYEGTGMGLAICRKIVECHGGSITARSTPGKGSTFIIELPQHQ